jgi:transposase
MENINLESLDSLEKEQLIDIIKVLIVEVVALREEVATLKEQLNKNSNNSSKPPSSDGYKKPPTKSLRGKTGKKPGGQKGHKGSGLKIDRTPDSEIDVLPEGCPDCGEHLLEMPMSRTDTRYVYDVEINVNLTKYDIYETTCPNCGITAVAAPPPECKSTINYGNMVRTLCTVLTQYGYISIDKTHKILRDLIGMPISTGTVNNIQRQFAGLTGKSLEEIQADVKESTTACADETGGRVGGETKWWHVVSTRRSTYLTVHKKRGKEGYQAAGVLENYTGNLVHDGWKPYFGLDKCTHSRCCAHLLRDLNGQIERGCKWAAAMKELLLEMKHAVDRYKESEKSELSRYYLDKFKQRYDEVLAMAKAEIVPSETRKKSTTENLYIQLCDYRAEFTRFANDFDVPFDNNQAERDIRNLKTKNKVSGGFRTHEGAEDYAKTTSVIGTFIKRGLSVVGSIFELFAGRQPLIDGATE